MSTDAPKRATLRDVAERLGVSIATVSRAFATRPDVRVSPATRERVLKAASELGYIPNLMARAVVRGRTGVFGLLGNMIVDPHNAALVQGMMVEARRFSYQAMAELLTSPNPDDWLGDQRLQIQQMMSWGVDGMLIQTRDEPDQADMIRETVRGAVPVATFTFPVEGLSGVVLDRAACIQMATEHLIRLGYRRTAFVGIADPPLPGRGKWTGYVRAMESHGLTPETVVAEDSSTEASHALGARIGRMSDPPRALVCQGDLIALGVCGGIKSAGKRVPDDVAVVGFDNIDIGALAETPLTTVAQPVDEICRQAMGLLMDQVNGDTKVKRVQVDPRLIVRESCGAHRARDGRAVLT